MTEMIKQMLEYADLLYKTALSKTENSHDADDLVQETYLGVLKAINKGTKIENMKAYLMKILNYKYCDFLKTKRTRYQLSLNELDQRSIYNENEEYDDLDTDLLETDEATIVRRELAFLSKNNRDILVMHYMEGKKVAEIAEILNIPVGTVKSRLDSARDKIKKGIEAMDKFTENSFRPDSLTLLVSGFTGMNNEPISVLSNAMEQNLLVLSYDKPIGLDELSKKIGIPMAYVEETVEKLIKHELMKQENKKVWTNFIIIDENMIKEKKGAQKQFVESHFGDVKHVYNEMLKEFKDTGLFKLFNDTQIYLYGLFLIHQQIREWLTNEYELLKWSDYPNRPNGGKWIILFGQRFSASSKDEFFSSYTLGGDFVASNSHRLSIELKDNNIGISPWRGNKSLSLSVLGNLLYSIHLKQDVDMQLVHLIPELTRLGFINNDKINNKTINIPIISDKECMRLLNIARKYSVQYRELISKELLKYVQDNVINYPKHIKPVSPYVYLLCMADIPLTYFYKAVKEGIVEYDKNKNYPICLLIEKE